MEALCEALVMNQAVLNLDVSNNRLFNDSGSCIALMLRKNTAIHTLRLRNCSIYADGMCTIFEALFSNHTLTKLNCSRNFALADGAEVMSRCLETNTTLTSLDLSTNFLYADGAVNLSHGLALNSTLQVLKLEDNEIGDEGMEALSSCLGGDSKLRELFVRRNDLTGDGIKTFFKKAKLLNRENNNNSSSTDNNSGGNSSSSKVILLEELDISENLVSTASILSACKYLSLPVSGFTKLKTLHINTADLSDKMVTALCETFMNNFKKNQGCQPTTLNFNRNNITAVGVEAIAALLKMDTGLEVLGLARNVIYDDSAALLAKALSDNTSLRSLNLASHGNRITFPGYERLWVLLSDNSSLLHLNLSKTMYKSDDAFPAVILAANAQLLASQQMQALVMGLHDRLGADSALHKVFKESGIADTSVLKCIASFMI
jgi:Ran GTPase-activating protein (RanGAP) involved in mRNA processing and transport